MLWKTTIKWFSKENQNWGEIFDFHWYRVMTVKMIKSWESVKLQPNENLNVNINFGSVKLEVSMNRFFQINFS
jgi:uncharacterized protein YpiB (UPF0302 family)